MISYQIGYTTKNHKPVYFRSRNYGCNLFVAIQGYGKSSSCKDIICKMANNNLDNRNIIIVDVSNEWENCLKDPNFEAEYPMMVDNMKVIRNLSIKLEDIKGVSDWVFFGFTGRSAQWLNFFNQNGKKYHENHPEKFFELITDMPTNQKYVSEWCEKYPDLKVKKPFDAQTVKAMQNFIMIKDYFFYENNDKGLVYIRDWYNIFKENKVVVIDLNVKSSHKFRFAGNVLGNIMQKWMPILKYFNPRIVVEEAKNLIGNPNKAEYDYYKCGEMAIRYAKDFRKHGVETFYIAQTIDDLNPEVVAVATQLVLGVLDANDRQDYFQMTKYLRYNLDFGKRQFVLVDRFVGQRIMFEPCVACCNVATQGAEWI